MVTKDIPQTLLNPGQPLTNWSEVVARGLKAKVPNALQRKDQSGMIQHLESDILYEDEKLAVIEKEIGFAKGFRPISLYGNQKRHELIIEAKFRMESDAHKAIKLGFTHQGIQYRGSPSNDGAENKLVRVSLSHLPLEDPDDLCNGLMKSLGYYGRVVQLKRYTKDGFFEEEAVAILDCSNTTGKEYQRLDRMLYLMEWDLFIPASFKGAPPVCYHCRQAGHVKATCPSLANTQCFHCHQNGHTTRNCKARIASFREEVDAYAAAKKEKENSVSKEERKMTKVNKGEEKEQKSRETSNNEDEMLVEMNTQQEDVDKSMTIEAEKEADTEMTAAEVDQHELKTVEVFESGTVASKHAPIEVATHMKVDTAKEMMILSTTKSHERKLPIKKTSSTPLTHKPRLEVDNVPDIIITDSKKTSKEVRIIDEPIIVLAPASERSTSKTIPITGRKAI